MVDENVKNKFYQSENFKILLPTILSGVLIVIAVVLQLLNIPNVVYSCVFITAFVIGGWESAKEGFGDLFFEKTLNVDILMVLAAIGASVIGYFEEAALLIFIFSLAEALEDIAMEKSKKSIEALMNLTPDTAVKVLDNGEHQIVPTNTLKVGDQIVIKKGECIPIDSILISEYASINEAAMTGESVAVDKQKGDVLIGGTINEHNQIFAIVSVENENTLFSKIIKLVEKSQEDKTKTATLIEKIENTYVKAVLVAVPLFILLTWGILQWDLMNAFYRGMILLTVASPCALVASATPATLSAISNGAKRGLLFKGGTSLSQLNNIDAMIFDKTGTLTTGNIIVKEVFYINNNKEIVNSIVKTAETTSTHPIAKAITTYLTQAKTLVNINVEDKTGHGLIVRDETNQIWKIGKKSFICCTTEHKQVDIEKYEEKGNTLIYVSKNDELQAIFVLEDKIKEESFNTIKQLQRLGITPIMITGDSLKTAKNVASQLHIDKIYANCLPNDKLSIMNDLKKEYQSVAMVGDGINDAPALVNADVSFALGTGSDIAMESADVVLMKDNLSLIPYAVQLSKKMKKITLQNIIFSLSVIALLIIANVFQIVSLPLGVIGHEGSTILVILNGLRLLQKVK